MGVTSSGRVGFISGLKFSRPGTGRGFVLETWKPCRTDYLTKIYGLRNLYRFRHSQTGLSKTILHCTPLTHKSMLTPGFCVHIQTDNILSSDSPSLISVSTTNVYTDWGSFYGPVIPSPLEETKRY